MVALKAARERLASFLQQGLVRSIGILVGGTVTAHAITLLAMPVSTRLYTPEHFSAISVFSGLVGILSVAACLRFDAAIALPEDDEQAANLLALSLAAAAGTAILLAGVLLLLPRAALDLLNVPSLIPYLWLVPVAVFITGVYLALQSWYIRRRAFGSIARSRAGQAAVAASVQIGMGFLGIAPLGLIVANVLNYGAGSLSLTAGVLARERPLLKRVSWGGMVAAFRAYDRFPRFSVWEGLANGLSNSAPLLIIAALSAGPEAGFLTLALFVLQAPMALIGNAVAQVYLSGAPEAHREGRLGVYTTDMFAGLLRMGAGPMIFAAIVSPAAFGLVFGEGWERSGVLVAWMAPWFLLQFLSAPISNALHVTGRQKTMMIFHLFGLVLRVGGVLIAGAVARGYLAEVWAVSGWLFYGAYVATILRVVEAPRGTVMTALRRSLPMILAGVAGGIIAAVAAAMISRAVGV